MSSVVIVKYSSRQAGRDGIEEQRYAIRATQCIKHAEDE